MIHPEFQSLPADEKDWLDAYLDGTITPDAFEAFQNRIAENAPLRKILRRYLALDSSLRNESGELDRDTAAWLDSTPSAPKNVIRFPGLLRIAAVATLAFVLGFAAMYWISPPSENVTEIPETDEPSARGFAVISQLFDVTWPAGSSSHNEGDSLGAEEFQLVSGAAEIQFFSGAMLTVQAPATISLESAWEAVCHEGSVRVQVPPAARGFKLHAPSTEIVDLGTEFGLEVRDGHGRVEVFDGEIEVYHRDDAMESVTEGIALTLPPDGAAVRAVAGNIDYPDAKYFRQEGDQVRLDSMASARALAAELSQDDRVIAYYSFDSDDQRGHVPNLKLPRNPESDGTVILAEPVDGRWPDSKSALEFRRPGSRVRVNIPGEFPAFTFMSWVRVDSLDRRYNALFMGDGYETGEPHWQIREDGAMMLSVMVDDTRPNPGAPNDAGFHRVYYSPPIWDLSMSGQWLHLASVFDPEKREVSHYVNGERIHRQEIVDKFFIDTLRIGNGEIGNWGEPFRTEPTFAIRNLNGRMDELAIFKAALGKEEIAEMYARSRTGRR